MALDTLNELLISELETLYSVENQLLEALPRIAKAASEKRLNHALRDQVAETEVHAERLCAILEELVGSPLGTNCATMESLLDSVQDVMAGEADPAVRDAALIATVQRAEHYQMAGYGCARSYAKLLGLTDVAEILQQTLDEEVAADKGLTRLAASVINSRAIAPASVG